MNFNDRTKLSLALISLVMLCLCCSPGDEKRVAIQPYQSFDHALIDTLQKSIQDSYGFLAIVMPTIPLPKKAYVNIKSPRYRADTLIAMLKNQQPDTIDFTIGLTQADISTTKTDSNGETLKPAFKYQDWGIFGLGYRPGPSCIVSAYRLKTSQRSQFIARLKKVCNHELGHNLGLPHCKHNQNCVMRDAAESIKTIDQVGTQLCNHCKRRL